MDICTFVCTLFCTLERFLENCTFFDGSVIRQKGTHAKGGMRERGYACQKGGTRAKKGAHAPKRRHARQKGGTRAKKGARAPKKGDARQKRGTRAKKGDARQKWHAQKTSPKVYKELFSGVEFISRFSLLDDT